MVENLSIAVHAFPIRMLTLILVDEMLLVRNVNWSTDFRGLEVSGTYTHHYQWTRAVRLRIFNRLYFLLVYCICLVLFINFKSFDCYLVSINCNHSRSTEYMDKIVQVFKLEIIFGIDKYFYFNAWGINMSPSRDKPSDLSVGFEIH